MANPNLTQITTQVIASNASLEPNLSNSSVGTRQLIDGSITLSKLDGVSVANLIMFANSNTSTGTSNVFFIHSPSGEPPNGNYVEVSLGGVQQAFNQNWIYNSGNDTIQFKDSTIPAGLAVNIIAFVL